jgi:hypothetical protein
MMGEAQTAVKPVKLYFLKIQKSLSFDDFLEREYDTTNHTQTHHITTKEAAKH